MTFCHVKTVNTNLYCTVLILYLGYNAYVLYLLIKPSEYCWWSRFYVIIGCMTRSDDRGTRVGVCSGIPAGPRQPWGFQMVPPQCPCPPPLRTCPALGRGQEREAPLALLLAPALWRSRAQQLTWWQTHKNSSLVSN